MEERIRKARETNEKLMNQKQDNYYKKLQELDVAKREREVREQTANQMEENRIREANERREQAFRDAMAAEEARKRDLEERMAAHRERIAKQKKKEEEERMIRKLEEELRKKDKLDSIERIKRIKEFNRLQTLTKLEHHRERAIKLAKQKQKLINERKKASQQARLRKFRLEQTMQKVRVTKKWSGLNLDKVM